MMETRDYRVAHERTGTARETATNTDEAQRLSYSQRSAGQGRGRSRAPRASARRSQHRSRYPNGGWPYRPILLLEWLRRCGSNGLTGASEGDRPTAQARVKLGLRPGRCIPLQPFLLAQNPGYEHVGQALRFCLSDLVRMKAYRRARSPRRSTSASTLASRRSIRKALGFMGAGPLARSACPLIGNPVGNLVHAALKLL